jgi:hypothetical protein
MVIPKIATSTRRIPSSLENSSLRIPTVETCAPSSPPQQHASSSIMPACPPFCVLRFATNVQIHDTFWFEEQNYSIYDMLSGKEPGSLAPLAKGFEGGSVYQAFCSSQDYHRWHNPVQGKLWRVTNTTCALGRRETRLNIREMSVLRHPDPV